MSQEEYLGLAVHSFESKTEWLDWLEANHTQAEAVWLKMAKKATGLPSIDYGMAREGALCYGWIDGQSKSLGATHFLQKFSPRRARSKWSKVNCDLVEEYIRRGLMKPSGLAQIEAAKADGRWDNAYLPPSQIVVPEDFAKLLEENPPAAERFQSLKQMERYRILFRLHDAKKRETREKRKQQFLQELLETDDIAKTLDRDKLG